MRYFECCYAGCPEPGTIHIGVNGSDSHWICWRHLCRWNQTRARFLADGGGCEMGELGELVCRGGWDEGTTGDVLREILHV
jgi:hypothetical protein